MPGLVVTTSVRTGAVGTLDAPASSLFLVGTAERGPTDEYKLIQSMTQAVAVYGDYDSTGTLHQNLEVFFEEGGTRAYVIRVAGTSAAAVGTQSLNSGALTLAPVGVGTWAASGVGDLEVQVLAGTTQFSLAGVLTATKRVKVYYQSELIYTSGDFSTNRGIAEAINANVGNYLVAGYNDDLALVTAQTKVFSGGVSDNTVTNANVITALDYFVPELGAGVVAAPTYTGAVIWDGLRDHALENNRIAYCAFAVGSTLAAAITAIETGNAANDGPYYGVTDAQQTDASCLSFFWPWVEAPTGTGGTRNISPETFAAAARCRAHVKTGPWRPAAGIISASTFVSGLVASVDSVTSDTANLARINPLRVIEGTVRVYGARSISADEDNWRYNTHRDVLNYIVTVAEKRLEPFIFNVIDSRKTVFADIAATLTNLLEPLRASGGIYEGPADRGYLVEVSEALNPQAQLASGIIAAKVGVRVSSVGETINLLITKSNLTTAI